jgi:hypothetical protein
MLREPLAALPYRWTAAAKRLLEAGYRSVADGFQPG